MSFHIGRKHLLGFMSGLSLVTCAVALNANAPAHAQFDKLSTIEASAATPTSDATLHMQVSLSQAVYSGRVHETRLEHAEAIADFYRTRHYQRIWTDDHHMLARGHHLFEAIETSWQHGLNPDTYHYSKIKKIMGSMDPLHKVWLDILMTDAAIRYVQHMSGMRVDPTAFKLDVEHWSVSEPAEAILLNISNKINIQDYLKSFEPQSRTYKILQNELIRLIEEPVNPHEKFVEVKFKGILKPGWGNDAVPLLRERMGLPQPNANHYKYDAALVEKVKAFQKANKLKDDGIIGQRTLEIMNRSRDAKIRQLIVNLERLRWADDDFYKDSSRAVIVNVPSASLWALRNGRVQFEMPVIVGKAYRKTQTFRTEISGVRFNPDWTVPPTIKYRDILPKLRKDVNYLNEKGIDLIKGYGSNARRLNSTQIDWNAITFKELAGLRMVQAPGEDNPLGRIRILMENKYNIYLHDTNKPEYFERSNLALSSGCMRMKDPERMAQFIMNGTQGWSDKKMNKILSSGEKTDIEIEQKIPIYIKYYTAWADATGRVIYGPDVYNHDEKLYNILKSIDGISIPRQNIPTVAFASVQ